MDVDCLRLNQTLCVISWGCAWCVYKAQDDPYLPEHQECINFDPCDSTGLYCFHGVWNETWSQNHQCHHLRDFLISGLIALSFLLCICLLAMIKYNRENRQKAVFDSLETIQGPEVLSLNQPRVPGVKRPEIDSSWGFTPIGVDDDAYVLRNSNRSDNKNNNKTEGNKKSDRSVLVKTSPQINEPLLNNNFK